jgi:large subunit ribosomal protein L19
MDLIRKLEQEEIARLDRKIPDFAPGDTVIVKVTRGRRRQEAASRPTKGVVIAKRNRGPQLQLHRAQDVRAARAWSVRSRRIRRPASIEVKRKGDVRRAKLYYLRGLTGKAARIREKLAATEQREVLPPGRRSPGGRHREEVRKRTPAHSLPLGEGGKGVSPTARRRYAGLRIAAIPCRA